MHSEAENNVKFLSICERHFKTLAKDDLVVIKNSLPKLMDSLKFVWTVSRHYKKMDNRMQGLIKAIANEIARKVIQTVKIETIFKEEDAIDKIEKSREVLQKLNDSYFNTKNEIQQSSTENRWEFNYKVLFAQII
jgi:dynein heavy chain